MIKILFFILFVFGSDYAYAALPSGGTAGSETVDGAVKTYYTKSGSKLYVAASPTITTLAAAKTESETILNVQKTYYDQTKTNYQAMIAGLDGTPDSSDETTSTYIIGGKTWIIPIGTEADVIAYYTNLIANIDSYATFLEDLKAAINAL